MRASHPYISTLLTLALALRRWRRQAQSALLAPFTEKLESERARLVDLRRDIHLHPETSGKEERTAGLVAERLRAAGYEVRTGVGGHGVIGVLRGGKPGPIGRLPRRHGRGAVGRSRPGRVSIAHSRRPPHLRPRRAHHDRASRWRKASRRSRTAFRGP